MKKLLLGGALGLSVVATAHAIPVNGSFSATGSGAYLSDMNAAATATTATRLDFGSAFSGTGNGFGTAGTILVTVTAGSFTAYSGLFENISDLQFGSSAGQTTATSLASPFISFGNGALTLDFSTATVSRSANNTGLNVTGLGTFTVGTDASQGTFALTTTSAGGQASGTTFTFTTSAQSQTISEPASLCILGVGLAVLGLARLRRRG